MKLQELIDLADGRDLLKSYIKSDGLYIWDYKLIDATNLELIVSDSGKAGYKDKVSIQELVDYVSQDSGALWTNVKIIEVEGITIAKV